MATTPTETEQPSSAGTPAPAPLTLPRELNGEVVDVRRKRPPVLTFLLRAETLRQVLRVISSARARLRRRVRGPLDRPDGQGGAAQRRLGLADLLRGGAQHDRLRLPGDRPAVRALRALRRARPAPRPAEDRHVAVPGGRRRPGLRRGQRRALLELLHLLRDAGLRDRLRRLDPLGLREGHRARSCAPPATAAARCWSAPATTSRTSRTR